MKKNVDNMQSMMYSSLVTDEQVTQTNKQTQHEKHGILHQQGSEIIAPSTVQKRQKENGRKSCRHGQCSPR